MMTFITTVRAIRDTPVYRGFACLLLLAGLLLGSLLGASSAGVAVMTTANATVVTNCRKDLAQRLKLPVEDITTVDTREKVWTDAALGMPEPEKMYAQVLTPGWRIVLEARSTRYLYTTSDRAIRFGGPLSLWDSSMLYVEPVADEPNMNGDLYQCSLIGTNHIRLVSGVSASYPQAKGMILFTRRTSRSGYDLLSVRAGKGAREHRLYGAFYIGEAALNETQDTWAAFVRTGLGSGWSVAVAKVGDKTPVTLPLPDGVQPKEIAWSNERIMILTSNGTAMMPCYETTPTAAAPAWKAVDCVRFPGALDYVLNKSESLEITQTGTKEQPSVEVARVWFTGDRNDAATINGLTLRGDALFSGYAFIWGEQNGQTAVYSVQFRSGEVTPGYHGEYRNPKLFKFPPINKP